MTDVSAANLITVMRQILAELQAIRVQITNVAASTQQRH